MNAKKIKSNVWTFLAFLVLASCGGDDEDNDTLYENGVLVINEGNFTEGDASLSFIKTTLGKVFTGIFSSVNNGKALGDVANDAMFYNDLLYVVVNNSNKMEVVNKNTLKLAYTLVNLALPRNVMAKGEKGYLTEWVSFSDPGRVTFFDLETGAIEESVTVGRGAEDMVIVNGLLYVSNQFSNSVSVIDLSDNSIKATISVGNNPDDMIVDSEQKIWLICQGGYDLESPYAALNNGQLLRIDPATNTVETTIELNENVKGRLSTNASSSQVYFLIGNDVYDVSSTATSLPTTPFVSVTDAIGLYGLGVDPKNDDVYALDAKGFQTNGNVYRYSASAELIDSYTVGRGPNQVLFN